MREECDDTPKVAVVTLTYNHEPFLRDCLEGIVRQRVSFPIEAFVVDDASTDGTRKIIKEYADAYPDIFTPIYFDENQFSKGRSHFNDSIIPSLRKRKPKYVAICEGDDYWTFDGKLQRQVDFLDSHPDYTACFHHYNLKDETGNNAGEVMFNLRHSRRLSLFDILIESQIQTATTVMRTEILTDDKELNSLFGTTCFTDLALFLALYNAGKVYCFREWWSVYRIHRGGISYSADAKMIDERHLEVLCGLGRLYGGKYRGLDRQWLAHIAMRDSLAEATYLRRDGKYLRYLCRICRAFLSSPRQFVLEYYSAYR